MKIIRRVYFYLLSLISIQVVLWAVINLVRTIFSGELITGVVDWLAGGIAFVLVGMPIFLMHWTTIQREVRQDQDVEERNSRVRSVFLYAALLSTGIPISFAIMAILNRLFTQAFGLSATVAVLGGTQTHTDNLIAAAANLMVLVYFWRVLKNDWVSDPNNEDRREISRLHRYLWMVYGLGLLTFGTHQALRYIFTKPLDFGRSAEWGLAAGLTLIVVGLPIWLTAWSIIQRSLARVQERQSMLRLVVFYLLTLGSLGFTLVSLGSLAANGLRWVFQVESWTLPAFIDLQASQLSTLVLMGTLWAYFDRSLWGTVRAVEDELRQAALRRIYTSVLSLGGLIASFVGLILLFGAVIEGLFTLSIGGLGGMLSDALAVLIIGLPLWLRFWMEIQRETTRNGEIGVHGRRSVLRKGYLYLVLFSTVVGAMLSSGWWIYGVLNALLGSIPSDFWLNFALQLRIAAVFGVFLLYHLKVLRADGREARHILGVRNANFPILVLQVGEMSLGGKIVDAIQHKLPSIPVRLHRLDQSPLEDNMREARAIVMAAPLAVTPPDALRSYLSEYSGKCIVVPVPTENWFWLGAPARSEQRLAQETAAAVQQLAEGQPIHPVTSSNAWSIVAYVLGGIFGLQIVLLAAFALLNLLLN